MRYVTQCGQTVIVQQDTGAKKRALTLHNNFIRLHDSLKFRQSCQKYNTHCISDNNVYDGKSNFYLLSL